MRFLTALIDALVGFVQRNPLTVLVIVVLGFAAPALLRGIALFILYSIMFLLLLVICGILLFRWRIHKLRREAEAQFGQGFGAGPGADPRSGFGRTRHNGAAAREGEVKVHRTSAEPGKRVASDVGDYVEFEETKE